MYGACQHAADTSAPVSDETTRWFSAYLRFPCQFVAGTDTNVASHETLEGIRYRMRWLLAHNCRRAAQCD